MILLIFGSLNVFINFCNKIVFDDIVCLLEVVIFVFSLMFIWGDKCIFGMCNIVNFCCIVIRLIVYFFIFMFFFWLMVVNIYEIKDIKNEFKLNLIVERFNWIFYLDYNDIL